MEQTMRFNAFIVSFLATGFLARPGSAQDEITVYVAQSCKTPGVVQRVAETTASRLFGRIGVSVRFIHTAPPESDTEAITLRIRERAPGSLAPNVLGSAWLAHEHQQANVFCDRLTQFYSASNWHETGVLQGYAIAHELGHVLRAEPGHSPAGVMRQSWRQADVIPMLQGTVNFCRSDAERIRQVLSERSLISSRTSPPARSLTPRESPPTGPLPPW